jgi:hypothetical protein
MNFTVNIYQCDKNHIHVVLQGQAVGITTFRDFEAFIRFVEACQEFINGRSPPIPRAFLEAFKQEEDK